MASTTAARGLQSTTIASAASFALLDGVGNNESDGVADVVDGIARQNVSRGEA
jgi:hypothetical protein